MNIENLLKEIGINTEGKTFEEVINELSTKWDTLKKKEINFNINVNNTLSKDDVDKVFKAIADKLKARSNLS